MIDSYAWREPCPKVVQFYIDAFNFVYQGDEQKIINAFRLSDSVDRRIYSINAYYHSRVPREKMTKVIENITNLDSMIAAGKAEAVERIADCDSKNYFSFATKYCSFAEPELYPIFDSLCTKALGTFYEEKHFYDGVINFEYIRKERRYENYREIVKSFRAKYSLEMFSYKEIDQFLWLMGKNSAWNE